MSETEQAAPEADDTTTTATEEQAQPDAEPTPTDDGDTFDAARALEKIRKSNAEARQLRERAKAAEQKATEAGELAARVPELEQRALRAELAVDLGIPLDLAARIQGTTLDEMRADAEKLLALVAPKAAPKQSRPVESLQPGSGRGADMSVDDQIAAAQAAGDWRRVLTLQNSKLAAL